MNNQSKKQRDTIVSNIVQLSDIVVLNIIGFIECNIDKICLTLSCKSLFTRFKDRLLFKWSAYHVPCAVNYDKSNPDPLYAKWTCIKNGFRLKSYQQSYHLSTNHHSYYFISSLQQLKDLNNNSNVHEDEIEEEEFNYKEWVDFSGEGPYRQHTIAFHYEFNEYIPPNTIPKHIRHIKFGINFNQPIDHPDILPPKLESLYFCGRNNTYDYHLTPEVLPSTLKALSLPYGYKFSLTHGLLKEGLEVFSLSNNNTFIGDGILPSTIKMLRFGPEYKFKLKNGDLPDGTRHIEFPDILNVSSTDSILSLPKNVEYVRFPFVDYNLNQIPTTIKRVDKFPREYLHLLPPTVTYLDLGGTLDWSLLPRGLEHLRFDSNQVTNQSYPSPPNLETIELISASFEGTLDFIPPTIKKLHLKGGLKNKLPHLVSKTPKLETIEINSSRIKLDTFFKDNEMPSSLHTLSIISGRSTVNSLSKNSYYIPPTVTTLSGMNLSAILSCNRDNVKRITMNGRSFDNCSEPLLLSDIINLDQLHIGDPLIFEPHFDIRRLSPNTILLFSNTSLLCGILTYNDQDLNKSLTKILLDDTYK